MAKSRSQSAALYELIKRPLITEKCTSLLEHGQYVFEVDRAANKVELAQAFEQLFPGRKVLTVRTLKSPGERKRKGKHTVQIPDKKKAVFTVEGEPIELFTGV